MHAKIYDRTGQPVVFDLWVKPQTNGFHEFLLFFSILLQIDRSQLTAVNCNRRGVKTTPQKTRFRSMRILKSARNSHTGEKCICGNIDNK